MGFPGGASGKETICQCKLDVRDVGSIPGWGRSPGVGNGNPLWYSCLVSTPSKCPALDSQSATHRAMSIKCSESLTPSKTFSN